MNVLLLAALSGCASADSGVFAGPVQPVAGTCDPVSRATLAQHNSAVIFTPASGTIELTGHMEGDDIRAGLTLEGASKQPYNLSFVAKRTQNVIQGLYTTPRCQYHVRLERAAG